MKLLKKIIATILVVPVAIIMFVGVIVGAIGFGFWSFITWD